MTIAPCSFKQSLFWFAMYMKLYRTSLCLASNQMWVEYLKDKRTAYISSVSRLDFYTQFFQTSHSRTGHFSPSSLSLLSRFFFFLPFSQKLQATIMLGTSLPRDVAYIITTYWMGWPLRLAEAVATIDDKPFAVQGEIKDISTRSGTRFILNMLFSSFLSTI